MSLNNRTYNIAVVGLMAVYSVLCFAVPEAMKAMASQGNVSGPMGVLIGAAPAYPLAAVAILYVKRILQLDELQQQIELLSLAAATGLLLVGGTAYGFVTLHLAYPEFPLLLIMPVYLVVWCVSRWFVKRGYA